MNINAKIKHNTSTKILKNISLKKITSFKIGGKAKAVYLPQNLQDIIYLKQHLINPHILGAATNVLASDKGCKRPIIMLQDDFGAITKHGDNLIVEAGAKLNKVCLFALSCGLSGLENLYGIPGSIGGAVKMNAGAFNTQISDVVEWVLAYQNNKIKMFDNTACQFGYRTSCFDDLIIKVCIRLHKAKKADISQKMADVINRRKQTQPLDKPSAGSIFKRKDNIIVSKLIEEYGLKGYNINDAQISEKHAGFIVNTNSAKCSDVLLLIKYIKSIFRQHGIELEEEIKYLGDNNDT